MMTSLFLKFFSTRARCTTFWPSLKKIHHGDISFVLLRSYAVIIVKLLKIAAAVLCDGMLWRYRVAAQNKLSANLN